MSHNFFDYIYESLRQNSNQELILWPKSSEFEKSHAYAGQDILDRITAIGAALTQHKIEKGDKILLSLPVEFDLVCTILAVMALGGVPILPPAAASPTDLLVLVRREKIKVVVTKQKPAALFAGVAALLRIRWICTNLIIYQPSECLTPQNVDPTQPALITHSSGSLGQAKSIHRSHQVLTAQHLALRETFPPWPGQRDFPLFPNVLLHNLALGTVSIIPAIPALKVIDMASDKIVRQISTQGVQTLTGNVYYFDQLLQYLPQHPADLTCVRAVGIGGSPVPEGLAHALRCNFPQAAIYIIYGSSEAEPIAVRKVDEERLNPRLGFGVGLVHASLQWKIDPAGTLTFPDGSGYPVGEIEVSGPHVVTQLGERWFQTGDYGYVNEFSQLFLTGRKGNQTLHQGVQHYQVEHVLLHVEGITKAAVRSLEEGFTVYIVGKVPEATIWQILNENFPGGIFKHLYFRQSLPVDSRHQSKIRYEYLT